MLYFMFEPLFTKINNLKFNLKKEYALLYNNKNKFFFKYSSLNDNSSDH